MGAGLVREVEDAEVEAFWRDGVVCLRGILDPTAVTAMGEPIRALAGLPELADMSAMGDALGAGGDRDVDGDVDGGERGRFISGVDHWRQHEAFRAFACDSGLPRLAAAVLRSCDVYLWEDSVLVKEPRTRERTMWHQDLAYFHVEGEQVCTTWTGLDVTDSATGAVRYVLGSHRSGEVFQPNLFVTTMTIPGTEGSPVPDIDALEAAGEVEVVSFATEPGDVIVHHARTIHGAGPNTSDRTARRAISVRYCGDDARYRIRPGAPMKPHHHAVADGEPLGGEDCPLVHRETPRTTARGTTR